MYHMYHMYHLRWVTYDKHMCEWAYILLLVVDGISTLVTY